MFNLLPYSEKKRIHHEALIRLFTALSVSLIVASVFGCLVLYSAKLFITSQLTGLKLEKANAESSLSVKVADLNKEAILFGKKVSTLLPQSELSLVDVIKKVVADKPSGVLINGFTYRFKTPKSADVTVAAIADSREAILRFVGDLGKEPSFLGADVPVSHFAKDTNIDFSVSFVASF